MPKPPPSDAPADVTPHAYVMTPADLANDVTDLLRAAKRDDYRAITTGHVELDRVVTMYPQSLTGILGRPSHGKSMLCKALARRELERIQSSQPCRDVVVYITLEESASVVGMSLGGWSLTMSDIVNARYDLAERERMAMELARLPLFVIRHPGIVNGKVAPSLTPERLYETIQTIATKYPADPALPRYHVSLVVLDYVQLLQGDKMAMSDSSKTAQVSSAIEGAKRLAVELSVPVVIAVQAGRNVDNRDDQMPAMADAQWASAIEQACDIVLGVHRPIRKESIQNDIRAGMHLTVNISGEQHTVTDSLMMIGLVKQRAGIGYGRYAAYLDPVTLKLGALADDHTRTVTR